VSNPSDKTGGTPEWVSCKHSIDRLLEYLDGTLPPEEKAKLDRHFKLCPPCLDLLRKYRAVPGICQKALDESLPDGAADRLTAFLNGKLKGC
jgi:anti-sigma factor RsiW